MSGVSLIIKRTISTTNVNFGKRNFKKFLLYNKRGSRNFKEQQKTNPDPAIPIDKRGVRDIGYTDPNTNKHVIVPEMIPDLIVPDLTDFKLKPYVSYRAVDIVQSEFTAQDLFNVVYAPKIAKDFKENKLKEDGSPLEPSPEEQMTPEEAKDKARRTGSDIF